MVKMGRQLIFIHWLWVETNKVEIKLWLHRTCPTLRWVSQKDRYSSFQGLSHCSLHMRVAILILRALKSIETKLTFLCIYMEKLTWPELLTSEQLNIAYSTKRWTYLSNRAWFGPKSQNHPKKKPLGWFKNPLLKSFLLWFYGISGEDFAIGSFL